MKVNMCATAARRSEWNLVGAPIAYERESTLFEHKHWSRSAGRFPFADACGLARVHEQVRLGVLASLPRNLQPPTSR
jgi:hypothetical protein